MKKKEDKKSEVEYLMVRRVENGYLVSDDDAGRDYVEGNLEDALDRVRSLFTP